VYVDLGFGKESFLCQTLLAVPEAAELARNTFTLLKWFCAEIAIRLVLIKRYLWCRQTEDGTELFNNKLTISDFEMSHLSCQTIYFALLSHH
jgi:hypothetical protein